MMPGWARRPTARVARAPIDGGAAASRHDSVTQSSGCWMEQFFVLKAYRRSGVGDALARFVFASHPGPWEVGQMFANVGAQHFWRKVTAQVAEGAVTEVRLTEGWWQGVVQQFNVATAV